MSTRSGHPSDEIQDLLDGRLDPAARARVEAHLEECEMCRRESRSLARIKAAAASALAAADPPADLAAATIAALDREDRPERAPVPGRAVRFSRPAVALAIAAAIALVAVILFRTARARDVAESVARDHGALAEESLTLEIRTADPQELERFFAERGIAFRTRVFDLGMMGFRLVGGRVHSVRGRPSALFVYRDERNKILVCQMYEGSVRELPRGAEVREHDGIPFSVYRRDGRTIVFWPEGETLCVLASDIDREELVALAFAKAVKS